MSMSWLRNRYLWKQVETSRWYTTRSRMQLDYGVPVFLIQERCLVEMLGFAPQCYLIFITEVV